jgi:hypothetical protein
MNRSTLLESFQETAKARAELAIALHNGDESEMLAAAKLTMEASAGLVDLVGEALELADDPSTDVALVFSEHYPEGTIMTLAEADQLEKAREPITVIRVAREMADALRGVLS